MVSHWRPGADRVENMSHNQRELTPPAFAEYLVGEVRRRYATESVAVLWVARNSYYRSMPNVYCYGVEEDASLYRGPWPVIAHPPCGPWGKLAWRSQQEAAHGPLALLLADLFGGVVEQPDSSRLFRGGQVLNQRDYGHRAEKRTRLYWADV